MSQKSTHRTEADGMTAANASNCRPMGFARANAEYPAFASDPRYVCDFETTGNAAADFARNAELRDLWRSGATGNGSISYRPVQKKLTQEKLARVDENPLFLVSKLPHTVPAFPARS